MIEILFDFFGDIELVVIKERALYFGSTAYGAQLAKIDNLKFDYGGVIKEHPDLADNPDWKAIAVERFKAKLKEFGNEREIAEYVINDLRKFGHKPIKMQVNGFRWEKI